MTRHSLKIATVVLALLTAAATIVVAHPMTHQGTVLAVEAARVEVKTVDQSTKKTQNIWFVVDKDTKVKRGEKTLSYAAAKITVGERIVVTVDMDAKTKMLATEIRLASKE
jgi:hypothetical protein